MPTRQPSRTCCWTPSLGTAKAAVPPSLLPPHTVSFTVSAFHDQDDEEELMKELARIKKERAEEAAKKVGQRP